MLSLAKLQTVTKMPESVPETVQEQVAESLSSIFAFQGINREENVWSARVTRGYRALTILEGDTVTWFWIGSHDEYERFIS